MSTPTTRRLSKFTTACALSLLLCACSKSDEPAVESPGKLIVQQNCKVCHAQGINGAPIIGNKKMWGPRITQGIPTLAEHAINGYGLMPAKGGNTELTDEQIIEAVTYMVAQAE